jgi:hypothetical protein
VRVDLPGDAIVIRFRPTNLGRVHHHDTGALSPERGPELMSNTAPTHEHVLALCKLVRAGGILTVEQRHYLAELLDTVGSTRMRRSSRTVSLLGPGVSRPCVRRAAGGCVNGPLRRAGARRVALSHLLTEVYAPG